MPKCQYCGDTEDVLNYYAKVGGSDELIEETSCRDIDKCYINWLTKQIYTPGMEGKDANRL